MNPVAWMHDQPGRFDVIHDEIKALWLKVSPQLVEHYTLPLYLTPAVGISEPVKAQVAQWRATLEASD